MSPIDHPGTRNPEPSYWSDERIAQEQRDNRMFRSGLVFGGIFFGMVGTVVGWAIARATAQ